MKNASRCNVRRSERDIQLFWQNFFSIIFYYVDDGNFYELFMESEPHKLWRIPKIEGSLISLITYMHNCGYTLSLDSLFHRSPAGLLQPSHYQRPAPRPAQLPEQGFLFTRLLYFHPSAPFFFYEVSSCRPLLPAVHRDCLVG